MCIFKDQFGEYEDRRAHRPLKTTSHVLSSAEVNNNEKFVKFRDFLCDESEVKPILVAVANEKRDGSVNNFNIALLNKRPWTVKISFQETKENVEYAQTGKLSREQSQYSILFKVDDVLVKVKPLFCINMETNQFIVQPHVRPIFLKIESLVVPLIDMTDCNAFNYLNYAKSEQNLKHKGFGTKEQVYQIPSESLDMLEESARIHLIDCEPTPTS